MSFQSVNLSQSKESRLARAISALPSGANVTRCEKLSKASDSFGYCTNGLKFIVSYLTCVAFEAAGTSYRVARGTYGRTTESTIRESGYGNAPELPSDEFQQKLKSYFE